MTVASRHGEGTWKSVQKSLIDQNTHKGRSSAIGKWLCLFRVDCHRAELVNGLIEQI